MGMREIFFHWSSPIPDKYVVVGPVLSEVHVSLDHTLQSVNQFLLRTTLFMLVFNLVGPAKEHDLPCDCGFSRP